LPGGETGGQNSQGMREKMKSRLKRENSSNQFYYAERSSDGKKRATWSKGKTPRLNGAWGKVQERKKTEGRTTIVVCTEGRRKWKKGKKCPLKTAGDQTEVGGIRSGRRAGRKSVGTGHSGVKKWNGGERRVGPRRFRGAQKKVLGKIKNTRTILGLKGRRPGRTLDFVKQEKNIENVKYAQTGFRKN